jgi:WD40 repeat protein
MNSYLKFASREWPFIGLRPFQYGDHEYFFGREDELNLLESQVTQKRFVAIVGGSGSGKSSLISAGLRARLDAEWNWVEMHPANAPIRKLALALADLMGESGDLSEAWADRFERILTKSSFGIGEALSQIPSLREAKAGRLLLLVDQFEELFRFANLRSEGILDAATATERRDEATAFVRLLLTAAKSQVPIHVILTMRSDFIGDCARFHGLPEAVSQSQFLVPGMTRDQREDVIRKPIRLAGGQVDADLVQRALNDTNEDPDQLPVLQHVLMRCWERAFRRTTQDADRRPHLTIDDYTKVGGVEHALSEHANEILKKITELDPSLERVTQRVFQALTETDQEGRSVRSPQRFCDLIKYVETGDASAADHVAEDGTRTVVRRFANPDYSFLRVIPAAPDADTDTSIDVDSIIDIGHEALIRRWDRLQGEGVVNWMREEQEDADRYRVLLTCAATNAFIPPEDLAAMERWWTDRSPSRFWAQRYTKHRADNLDKAREVLTRSRARAAAAAEESKKYETRVIGLVAESIRVPRRFNGAADSVAMALNKPPNLPNVREYFEVLYSGLGELRERRRIEIPDEFKKQVFAVSFSPTGKLLAAVVPGNLLFYDTESGELVHFEKTKGGWVLSIQWSPDGKRIYVGTSPVGLIVAACSIAKLRKFFPDCGDGDEKSVSVGCEEHPAGYGAWSRDGKWIVIAGWQRRASLWDASEGRFKRDLGDESLEGNPLDCLSSGLAASPDGERIAVGAASGRIHIFDARSIGQDGPSLKLEKSLESIDKNTNPMPYSLVFDPQNHDRLLVGYMLSPYMALWKIEEKNFDIFGVEQSGPIWRVAFDPKGKFVASATNDTAIRLWWIDGGMQLPDTMDSAEKEKLRDAAVQLRGHLTSVFTVDVNPEDRNVASGSFDGTIRLWGKHAPLSARLLSNSVSMRPVSGELTVRESQISVTTNGGKKYSGTLPEEFGEAVAAAVSANGAGIAVVPRFGQPVLLLNLSDHLITVAVTLSGVKAGWTDVAFIENDSRIAATTTEGKIFAWPLYSDVGSLMQLAKEHLPVIRGEDGVDKRLEVPDFILRKDHADGQSDDVSA